MASIYQPDKLCCFVVKQVHLLVLFACLATGLSSCGGRQQVDLLVYNATIYTSDSQMSQAQAFAVKDGKFVAVGTTNDLLKKYTGKQQIDAKNKPIYPGFFDAHCHFYAYGKMKNEVDLTNTQSFDEVIERVIDFSKSHKTAWIVGRGWDQNRWKNKGFPVKDTLDKLFPNIPVYLARVDGHAALVNSTALKLAGIDKNTVIAGGDIIKSKGLLTGILVDNAADRAKSKIPPLGKAEMEEALLAAQHDCFRYGLTTVDDAGQEKNVIDCMDAMQKTGKLKIRVYAMLTDNPENLDHYLKAGPYQTDRLHICAFKCYADGALGSRGACLLAPYADSTGHYGFLLKKPEYYKEMARKLAASPFQMNTHCIGDSAVRFILDTYAASLGKDNNRRWRIEHAQVVSPQDMHKFGQYHIIPSVQPTHATSDMLWAGKRLGNERVKTAYAYQELLRENGLVADGSDYPVESADPLLGFYAAVARQDVSGMPPGGFQKENALTRAQALYAMTIWAAYANFEDKEKGSITPGKKADFVMLSDDIMKVAINSVPSVEVLKTYVAGELVYEPK